jgi:hypothetical protein
MPFASRRSISSATCYILTRGSLSVAVPLNHAGRRTLSYISRRSGAEVAAVPAPRFFVVRYTARFPRNASSEARKLRCSLLRMTGSIFSRPVKLRVTKVGAQRQMVAGD